MIRITEATLSSDSTVALARFVTQTDGRHYSHVVETLSRRGKSGLLILTWCYRQAIQGAAKMEAQSFVAVAKTASFVTVFGAHASLISIWKETTPPCSVHWNPRPPYRILRILLSLETAQCDGLRSFFYATLEAAEKISRGTGFLRTNGSAQVLGQGSAEEQLQARESGSWTELPPTEWITDSTLQSLFEDGILRIGGTLQFAYLSRKQILPILLHRSNHFTALLIMQTPVHLHLFGGRLVLSELREEFWILRSRPAIKNVLTSAFRVKLRRTPPDRSVRLLCRPIG